MVAERGPEPLGHNIVGLLFRLQQHTAFRLPGNDSVVEGRKARQEPYVVSLSLNPSKTYLCSVAIVGGCGLLVGGVFYLGSLPSESSFTITHRVKAPSKVLFANDIDPETYWKYFPRANKEQ